MSQQSKTPAEMRHVKKFRIHRLSGAWIFLIDNFFFGVTAMTGGLAVPLSCALAFLTGGVGVFLIQKLINKDSFGQAFVRGLMAGVLAGIPISIAGTVYGGWVLAMSGMRKEDLPEAQPPIEVQASVEDNADQRASNSSH